ncbi:MAG: Ig-like domain-containing protein, partial [Clostridia bacterium]|nr:Ig-like domain-containing protein [Clostridia bacterium]
MPKMKKWLVFLMAAALLLNPLTALAAGGGGGGGNGGGDGSGGGSGDGGGSAEALAVESSSLAEGGVLVAGESITLTFSKNVCHSSVRDANAALISLVDAAGAAVEITVTLADDQIEPDKRNDIVITPAAPLAEGSYTLTAAAGITSKSGVSTAEDYVLSFTAAAEAPAGTPELPAEPTPTPPAE